MRIKTLGLFFVLLLSTLTLYIVQVNANNTIIEINSASDLAKIGTSGYPINGHYKLMVDIDLSSFDAGDGKGWKPVGDVYAGFSGLFDGNYKRITGLSINRTEDFNGLFAVIDPQGVIKNLSISNVSIVNTDTLSGNVGALVGENNGTIENVHINGGSINQKNGDRIGGLVGFNRGSINNSSAHFDHITGQNQVGGLVGDNLGHVSGVSTSGKVSGNISVGGLIGSNIGEIFDASASGDVEGKDEVGGLIGSWKEEYGVDQTLTLINTHANGHVKGEEAVGGLIGHISNFTTPKIFTIQDSHALGNVYATGNFVGGLVGYNKARIENSSASGNVEGEEYVGGLVGIGYFGISGSWATGEVHGHKNVGGLAGTLTSMSTLTNAYATGNVSASLSGSGAIGGLIGQLEQSSTVNSSYASGHVSSAGSMVGGLIGQLNGTVNHSYAIGHVTGHTWVGGLVGYMNLSSINHGIATGTVKGGNETGGLIGYMVNSSVLQSYASGETIGKVKVGGLIGFSNHAGSAGSNISYSAAFGPVTGTGSVGGLVGELWGLVNQSYATGHVQSDGTPGQQHFGGLIGFSSDQGHVDNSYATGQIDGGDAGSVGGLIGSSFGGMHSSYATGHVNSSGSNVGGYVGLYNKFLNNAYYTGSVGASGNNLGTKLTSSELKQKNKLPGFSFITPSDMSHPWMMVPNVTNPIIRNPGNPSVPIIQLSASLPPTTVDIGDTVNLAGTVALSQPETYHLVPEVMKPLYLYYTIQDENGNEIKTGPIGEYASPQEIESFNTSIFIDSHYESSKTYKMYIWAITMRGAATYYEDSFTTSRDPELELSAMVSGGSQYKEGDWTSHDVTVIAHFSFDNPSQRQYVIVDQPTDDLIDIDDLTGWEAYTHPITLSTSGNFTVFFRTGHLGGTKIDQSIHIRIDKEAPTDPIIQLVGDSSGWAKEAVTLNLSEGTDTLSGVDYSEYKIGTGGWIIFKNSKQLEIEDEGITTINVRTFDKSGNMSQAEQEVKIDMSAPASPTIDLSGVNGIDGWASGTVTVSITGGSDAVSGVNRTEYKIGVAGSWATYDDEFDINDEGVTTIYARTYDIAGNLSAEAVEEIKIDLTSPASPSIQLQGVNGKEGWARSSVMVSISDGSDPLSGVDRTEYKIGADGSWAAYIDEIEIDAEGVTTIYARTYDKAGNMSATEAVGEIKIDETPPTSPSIQLLGVDGRDGWARGPVTVSILDGSDSLSGVDRTEYKIGADGSWATYDDEFDIEAEGITTVYARTYDKAGNMSATEAVEEINIDLTSPASPSIQLHGINGKNGWARGPVTVSILGGSDSLSGVKLTEYKFGADGSWTTYDDEFDIEDEGVTMVYARTYDKAGNISGIEAQEVKMDLTSPASPSIQLLGVDGKEGWARGLVTVSLLDGADPLSGVDRTEYKIGADGSWATYDDEFDIEDEGVTIIYARTYDRAGNISGIESHEVKIDLTSPASPLIQLQGINGKEGWARGPVTINLLDGADPLSGVDRTEFKIGTDGSWTTYVDEIEIDAEGVNTVYARTYDKAGNISGIESHEVRIDLTSPASPSIQLQGVNGKDGWANDTVTITLISGADTLSGLDYSEYKIGVDGSWETYLDEIELDTEGIMTVYARTYDKAGNISDVEAQEVKIDLTVPDTPTINLDGVDGKDDWASGMVTVSIIDGSDALSGVDQTEYKIGADGSWEIYTNAFEIITEGITSIYARTHDKAGHISEFEAYEEVKIDSTAPAMPTIQPTGAKPSANIDSWLDGPIIVEIIDGIDDHSGIDYTEYKINESDWIKYTNSFEIDDAYITMVTARSVDKVGKISDEITQKIIIASNRPAPPMPSGVERIVLADGAEGTLSFDQAVTVTIPAGSTDELLILTIEEVTAEVIPENTDTETLLSGIYEILKNIVKDFNKDISITLAFDPSKLSENQIPSIFYFDELLEEWIEIGGTQDGNKITAQVNHLTKFAVFAVSIEDKESTGSHLADIEGHWAENNIALGIQKGFINGYPDLTFRPERQVTRAEFIVMLMKAMNATGSPIDIPFTDQSVIGPWAANFIAQAQKANIIQGYGDGSFRPNNPISRAEMSVIIANVLDLEENAIITTGFADDHAIPSWAKGKIEMTRLLGIVSGRGNNTFAPNDYATRAEAVTVILNWLEHHLERNTD